MIVSFSHFFRLNAKSFDKSYSSHGDGDTPSLPISLMGIFRWQHWQTGRLFNWGGAAAPALPHYIMAEWLLKKGADGAKRLAGTLAPPKCEAARANMGTATRRPSQFILVNAP
jgi:hypothetical protein